ncbi:MAG: HAD family phosphatase [Varibaculum sp.]|nr:HAD family phosphatase [Varibaculum sp.]
MIHMVRRGLPQALLFDLDGTLLDSEPLWLRAETAVLAEFGMPWNSEYGEILKGGSLRLASEQMVSLTGAQTTAAVVLDMLVSRMATYYREEGAPWFPGVPQMLSQLAEIPKAIVTSSYRGLVDAALGSLPQGAIDLSVSGDEVSKSKPDPQPYLQAAEMLGVEIRDCCIFEDSLPGLRSGCAAGARVVIIGNTAAPENCDQQLPHLSQVSLLDEAFLRTL